MSLLSSRIHVARLARGAELRFRRAPMMRVVRPLACAVAASLLVVVGRRSDVDGRAPNRSAALAGALAARGLTAAESDVVWLGSTPAGLRGALLGGQQALVRARERGEPGELYLVDARLSPDGQKLLEIQGTYNISRTTDVDEALPIVSGNRAATATAPDGIFKDIHVLDLAGRSPSVYTDFTRVQRWQTALSNLQQTGQERGVVHDLFVLDPPASDVRLTWESETKLAVLADQRRMVIDTARATVIEGQSFLRAQPEVKAAPGRLVTWAVDRVRAMPWFGEEKMQVLKAVVYMGFDYVARARAKVTHDNTAQDVATDLAGLGGGQKDVSFIDPEIGWPPLPVKPIISPALPGEGQWILLDHDPFIHMTPGVPSAFVTTFLRADKARLSTRVYVTMWDPRQIALHMQAGTVEPVSATGEAGSGEIPRTPEVLDHLVAGFNGGFQAVHGEYGMQADGVLYLPPKPYAATVLEMRDGSVAMGAWPENTEVSDDVMSFRQNLTAIVQDGRFNPWGRTWWGGTPKGWADEVHTTRSGICLTKENFVGYFWGNDLSADVLAAGMLAARCAFGLHLDMNTGHAGFEFYNVQRAEKAEPIGRALQTDWEFDGTLKSIPDMRVRSRRMVKTMGHMNFPRYIHRDERDFFYLTRRAILPGPALWKTDGEGSWRVKGLPQHGFPYAMAATSLHPDEKRADVKVRILRVDPRTVRPAGTAGANEQTVIVFNGPAHKAAGAGVWLEKGVFLAGTAPPSPDALGIALGVPASAPAAAAARVFAGVEDEEGMLVWAELAPDTKPGPDTAASVDALLKKMGCSVRVATFGDARALLGGQLDIAGEAATVPVTPDAVRLVRGAAPDAHPYFESTPIVRPSVWQPLQMQRVRYFHHKKSPSGSDAGAP